MSDLARGGRGLSQGPARPGGSVTRSPVSQLFELRAGRGGPTPPPGRALRHPPDATRGAHESSGQQL